MSAAALLAELVDAGVTLTRNGDRLHYRTQSGVSIGPFAKDITANKPELLMELLQREIVAAVNVEPADFDRRHYGALWSRYHAL